MNQTPTVGQIWLENFVAFSSYLLTAFLSVLWASPNLLISAFWPPTGIILAMMILTNYRVYPGFFLAAFIFTMYTNYQGIAGHQHLILEWQYWLANLIMAIFDIVGPLIAAWLILYFTHTKTPFYNVRDVFIFIFIGAYLGAMISPSIAIPGLIYLKLSSPSEAAGSWLTWWLGDAVGILAIAPIILLFSQEKKIFPWEKTMEFASLLLLLSIAIVMIYYLHYPISYTLIPFCIWAAVRFGQKLALLIALIISILSVGLEIHGYKEFQNLKIFESLLFIQAFMAVVFFTTMTLSAALAEREQAQAGLRSINEKLEERVKKRTEDLDNKNYELNQALDNLKQTEHQLVQAEKMSLLGVLTAGISQGFSEPVNHIAADIEPLTNQLREIKNLLQQYLQVTPETIEKVFTLNQSISKTDLPILLSKTNQLIESIQHDAKQTATIVNDLRVFSRLDENARKKMNVNENIDSVLVLLRTEYAPRITIIKNYADLPEIECFPNMLNQVFMNILLNAIQAIPKTGNIYITTAKFHDQITISIRDTGVGMSANTLNKIFEPFFTTSKEKIGLGLTISQNIIQQHAGTIKVVSELGEGSEFIITLPISFSKINL